MEVAWCARRVGAWVAIHVQEAGDSILEHETSERTAGSHLAGSAAGGDHSGSARALRQRMPAHSYPSYCALLSAPEALWAGGVSEQHDHHDGKEHGGSQGSNQRRLALPQRCRAGGGVHVAGGGVEDGS